MLNKLIKGDILLSPSKVTATEFQLVLAHQVNKPTLTIKAEGYAEGITAPTIKAIDLTAEVPLFVVTAQDSPAIGFFPYTAQQTFDGIRGDLTEISIQTPEGITTYPVIHLLSGQNAPVHPKALSEISEKQIAGYAYNQSNFNVAFNNAVSQLYKKFPGHISAKVVESGFVAAGSPVGIAYTYVVMEQESN
ncbi:hypothetical protein [Shewanella surugensis]|uniref:Uncharacterized protein n=1 Tax=Shewanella surugensis TaxID=212020 RepID=A0ABT0LHV7_9GAMM|nr:hypothetical protein [Shewanella surugensis]MCL1127250.1 hypothetical protein [Shewanella surugensis]